MLIIIEIFRLIIDHHIMKILISISNGAHHSCCEAWEELGKGDRCEFQSFIDTKSGEANGKSGEVRTKSKEVRAVSDGFQPDPEKPQAPADQPKCKLR